MSENVDFVRRAYEYFRSTGELNPERFSSDFVWDMSEFSGWPERQTYQGAEGARTFLREWREAWDEWSLEVESLHDAGDEIVAILRQAGKSKTSGLEVEMVFAQVWTVRDGQYVRMRMYAEPAEALAAVGLRTT
jgi:ketosteroid isomerase-like protein